MTLDLSTEALARESARRPWLVVGVWAAALAVAGVLISAFLGTALTAQFSFIGNPESDRAEALLEARLRGPRLASEIVVLQSDRLTVDDEAFEERVRALHEEFVGLGPEVIAQSVHYYRLLDETFVSADRRKTIMPLVMAGSFDDATRNVEKVFEIVRRADAEEGFHVLVAGEASIAAETNDAAERDLQQGEATGVPAAFVILVVVFGALVAALVPILLTLFAIVLALAVTALIGQGFPLSFFVVNMITMIGLAVGIDYSLFIVSRYREERDGGLEKIDAIARTGATATRAVFFSGLTVVLALVGLLIIPTNLFLSLGLGAIVVVLFAVLASLTLLPSVLSLLGDRVNALAVPVIGRRRGGGQGRSGGFWDWVTRGVMRHPTISLALSVGLLLAAALPLLDMNTGFNTVDTLPDGFQTKEAFLVLEEEFSFGLVSPVEIVIDGTLNTVPVRSAIERLQALMSADPAFVSPARLVNGPAGDLGLLSAPVGGEPSGDLAIGAVRRLREQYVPQSFAGVDVEVVVGGAPAFNYDFFAMTDRFTPIVFAVVLSLSFVLLTVVFRSIVVPIKAIIMNLLSVGAAYGIMVLVAQQGVGADLLGFQQSDEIDAWIPLFLFTVLFGLSMDYHVFLLSRIRERYDQTGDNTEAVAHGLRSTAGLITGAALIMVAVFSSFALGDLVMFQQVGFGLAVAVFLDATIVRSVLVPASMRLLGNANWYLPSVLRWLPDVRVELPQPARSGPRRARVASNARRVRRTG